MTNTQEAFAAKVVQLRAHDKSREAEIRNAHPGNESEMMRILLGTNCKNGITVNEYSALASPAVLAAVTNIQQTIAMLPCNVYRRNNDGSKVREANHPLEQVFKREWNAVQTAYDGKCVFLANLILRGRAYAQQVRTNGGALSELWNLSANRVEVTRKDRKLIFEIRQDDNQKKPMPRDEIFYVNGFRLEGWEGLSPVQLADRVIGIGLALDYFKRTFFQSGGNMRMALEFPGRLRADDITRIKDNWGVLYANDTDPSRVAVLENEQSWVRANPSINQTVYAEHIKEIHLAAQINSAKMDQFKRYHLNIWVRGFNRWMDMSRWNSQADKYSERDLLGKRCYGGLDLASTNDMNALVLLFPGEKWRVLSYFWLPGENINELQEQHGAPYTEWADENLLQLTDGVRCNYQEVRQHILALADKFDIEEIRFDPYNASNLVSDLANDGIVMVEQSQGKRSLSPPTKSLEIAIMGGQIEHNAHPIMDWMIGNVQVTYDMDENIKMVKAFRNIKYKIDGPVALVMAWAGATSEDNYYSSESVGVIVI